MSLHIQLLCRCSIQPAEGWNEQTNQQTPICTKLEMRTCLLFYAFDLHFIFRFCSPKSPQSTELPKDTAGKRSQKLHLFRFVRLKFQCHILRWGKYWTVSAHMHTRTLPYRITPQLERGKKQEKEERWRRMCSHLYSFYWGFYSQLLDSPSGLDYVVGRASCFARHCQWALFWKTAH